MNLSKMGRLILDNLSLDELDSPFIFRNLEVLNINETRITSVFVRKFLRFWLDSNAEKRKKSEENRMKNFMVLKCSKAYFVSSSVLDVFVIKLSFKGG